jgi:hypothetical protein
MSIRFVSVLFLGSLALFICPARGNAESLDPALLKKISKEYPGSKIILTKSCLLGGSKTPAVGLFFERKEKNRPDKRGHYLAVTIAVQDKKEWSLQPIHTSVSTPAGFDGDFLYDYADAKTGKYTAKNFEMRCTTPFKDADIGNSDFGHYSGEIPAAESQKIKHLCLTLSSVYNNWACYSVKGKGLKPVLTYAQMSAD